MKIEGDYTFEAPRDIVWQALQDPEILAKVMPGCRKLDKTGEGEYEGALKIKVGPVQGVFKGEVQLSDLNEPESYHMEVKGKGAASFVNGAGDVRLEEVDEGTVMHYSGDAQVGGRIASVGQRLLDSAAKSTIRQSLDALEKQIHAIQSAETAETESETAEAESDTAESSAQEKSSANQTESKSQSTPKQAPESRSTPLPEVETPSQMEFATNVAKDVMADLVPADKRPQIITYVVTAVVLFTLWNMFSNMRAKRTAHMVADILERRS